jgi:hypothetical protein
MALELQHVPRADNSATDELLREGINLGTRARGHL